MQKKTKHMLFDHKRKYTIPPFRINDELENVNVYKYLGVEIDTLLSYDKFIDNMWKKVNNRLFNFAKIRPYLSESLY